MFRISVKNSKHTKAISLVAEPEQTALNWRRARELTWTTQQTRANNMTNRSRKSSLL